MSDLLRWRHVIINSKNTWFHGDPRGFRSRKRRLESSGDYKNPPPEGEYSYLHRYFVEAAGNEVTFSKVTRPIIGRAIIASLQNQRFHIACIAIAKVHAHFLVQLPDDRARIKRIVGEAKHDASRSVSDLLPGAIWSAGGEFLLIENLDHLENAYRYILLEQGRDAWTWSFRDISLDGQFNRLVLPVKPEK